MYCFSVEILVYYRYVTKIRLVMEDVIMKVKLDEELLKAKERLNKLIECDHLDSYKVYRQSVVVDLLINQSLKNQPQSNYEG